MIIYCALRAVPMNSKLFDFFSYHPNLPLKNNTKKMIQKLKGLQFHFIKWLKHGHANLLFWNQCRYQNQIEITSCSYHWKVGGNGNPPFLIPALWKISILFYKQATHPKSFCLILTKNSIFHLCLQDKASMATIFILLMTSQAMSLFLALYHLSDYLISRRRKKEGSHRTKGPLELVVRGAIKL